MNALRERFESKVIPEPNSGCFLWCGAVDSKGYGQIRVSKKNVAATHVALALAGRPLPIGLRALHRCDTPPCVNPDHLFHGTQADNVADAIAKQRANLTGLALGRGPRHSAELREVVRRAYFAGEGPAAIATRVGLSRSIILYWMKEWGHQTMPQRGRSHCPQGHPYSGENLCITNRGDRQCRICNRNRPSKRHKK